MYADDLVLISPSSAGLFQLLHECEKFGTRHDLKYNAKKSVVMIQGRSKRSGWPGHGRTNNRAGNFFFLKFVIIRFGRNNNRAGIFCDVIFETETTQSPKCAL